MARFDVHPRPGDDGYLLDCQADLLSDLNTRFVVPLLGPDSAPSVAAAHLNPRFVVNGETVVLYPQFAASVPARELDPPVASLADEQSAVMNALDMLLNGF